ncbi:4'-phosphopantetheinyl transferase superfamily protein [Lachnospiraceae bacterium 54-53]
MVRIYLERYETLEGKKNRGLEHGLGKKLLDQGMKELYGWVPGVETPPVVLKGEHGKPFFKDHPRIHFNISHTDGMVACAIGDRQLGIDVERVRPYPESVPRRVFSEAERRRLEEMPEAERSRYFFRIWTLKESYVKAAGCGLTVPLTEISFDYKSDGTAFCPVPDVFFHQKMLEGEYVLSLCTYGEAEVNFAEPSLSSV